MGAVMKSGRYMTTPRGAARAQKGFDKFSQRHGARLAKRGVDIGKLGGALGFAPTAPTAAPAGPTPVAAPALGGVAPTPQTGMAARPQPLRMGRMAMGAMRMKRGL